MKLLEKQKLLADLYTNRDARENYFISNKGEFVIREIGVFSESLLYKRLNVIKSFLPLAFEYNYNLLHDLFIAYASINSLSGFHLKHQNDTFSFLRYLNAQPIIKSNLYLNNILSYEKFNLINTMPCNKIQLVFLKYKIPIANKVNIHDVNFNKGRTILFSISIKKKLLRLVRIL